MVHDEMFVNGLLRMLMGLSVPMGVVGRERTLENERAGRQKRLGLSAC